MTFDEEIAEGLSELRETHEGYAVTYLRGATEISLTNVIQGQWVFRFQDDNGTTKRLETQDFLIQSSQLAIAGSKIEPVIGDRLEIDDGDNVRTYEVVSPNNEGAFRYSDHARSQIRVHSLLTGTEDS